MSVHGLIAALSKEAEEEEEEECALIVWDVMFLLRIRAASKSSMESGELMTFETSEY